MIGRRVRDRIHGHLATVVEVRGQEPRRQQYRLDWDEPTPYQDRVWVYMPNEYFEWVDPEARDVVHRLDGS